MKHAGNRGETGAGDDPSHHELPGIDMTIDLTLPRELFAAATTLARAHAPLHRTELQPDADAWTWGSGVDVPLPLGRPPRPTLELLPPRHREHGHRPGLALEANWR